MYGATIISKDWLAAVSDFLARAEQMIDVGIGSFFCQSKTLAGDRRRNVNKIKGSHSDPALILEGFK